MSDTDDPAILAAQRAHKHAQRRPYAFNPDYPLTAVEQHELAARWLLAEALALAARKAEGER